MKNFEEVVARSLAEDEEEEGEGGGGKSFEKDEDFVLMKRETRERKLTEEGEERAYGKEVDWWSFGVVIYEVGQVFTVFYSICRREFESEIYSFFLHTSVTKSIYLSVYNIYHQHLFFLQAFIRSSSFLC